MKNNNRGDNNKKFDEDEILNVFKNHRVKLLFSPSDIAEILEDTTDKEISSEAIRQRLNKMHENDKVKYHKFGRQKLWYLPGDIQRFRKAMSDKSGYDVITSDLEVTTDIIKLLENGVINEIKQTQYDNTYWVMITTGLLEVSLMVEVGDARINTSDFNQ